MVVTPFAVSYTMVFIVLRSRTFDVMGRDKVAMNGAMAAFKDLGYTIDPLSAGTQIEAISIRNTFFEVRGAFILLFPIAMLLHD
jgi:hypothetical protein